jgi:hypothetical protein
MIRTDLSTLVASIDMLARFRQQLEYGSEEERGIHHRSDGIVSKNDRKTFELILSQIRSFLDAHHLIASRDRLVRTLAILNDEHVPTPMFLTNLQVLIETLGDELQRRYFLYLPPLDAALYHAPARDFPNALKAFPSIEPDVVAANQCYALGQDRACVFH